MERRVDVVIRRGFVVDGTGAPGFEADIAVDGGKIVEIGKVSATGKEEIDAKGQIVTPGFIDIHTHYDGQATWSNRLDPSSVHGVTSVIIGNCGVGFAPCKPDEHDVLIKLMDGVEDIPDIVLATGVPWTWESFPEFLDFLGKRSYDIDFGAYVPHAALRVYVMGRRGSDCEPATEDDIEKMAALLREAIKAGAFGLGTSRLLQHQSRDGKTMPTTFASRAELFGLAKAMRDAGGGIYQQVGAFVADPEEEFELLRSLAAETGCAVTFTAGENHDVPHHLTHTLELLGRARAEGLPISAQLAPRPIGFVMGHELTLNPFCATAPYRALAALAFEDKIAALRKPEIKAAILKAAPEPVSAVESMVRAFDRMFVLGDGPALEPSPAESVAVLAKRRGVSPEELTYDAMLENGGRTMLYFAFINYASMSLNTHYAAYHRPGVVPSLGDGGAHCSMLCDASYPTFMLSYMVRDRMRGPRLPLAFAVKSLTSVPADVVGLGDRGRLAPGYRADINVIDFDKLTLHGFHITHDLPAGGLRLNQTADGYTATLVNGAVTYRNGQPTGALPGRLIRKRRT